MHNNNIHKNQKKEYLLIKGRVADEISKDYNVNNQMSNLHQSCFNINNVSQNNK